MKIEPRSSFQNINEVQAEPSAPLVKKEPTIGQNATDRFEAAKTPEQTLASQSAILQPKGNEDGLLERQMLKARLGESTKKMKGATEAETINAPTTGLTSERFETVAEAKRLLQEAARQRGIEAPPELQSLIDRLNPFDDADDASGIPGLFQSPISFETIQELKEALEKYGQTANVTRTIDLGTTGETSESTSSLASKILDAIRKLHSDDEDEPSKTAKSTVGS